MLERISKMYKNRQGILFINLYETGDDYQGKKKYGLRNRGIVWV